MTSLADKLRTMRMARAEDGEAFAIPTSNERLGSPVSLHLRLIEASPLRPDGFPPAGDNSTVIVGDIREGQLNRRGLGPLSIENADGLSRVTTSSCPFRTSHP